MIRRPLFRARRAFTLIEVVVVLTLLSVVAALTWRSLSAGTRFYALASERLDALRAGRMDRVRLQRQIEAAHPWPRRWEAATAPAARQSFFRGSADRVEFLTPQPLAASDDGRVRRVAWARSEAARGLEVIERVVGPERGTLRVIDSGERSEPGWPFRMEPAEAIRMAGDRDVERFEFLGAGPARDGETWRADWDSTRQVGLPAAIRLSGRLAAGPQAGRPFSWVFPLTNRQSGWPSYVPAATERRR